MFFFLAYFTLYNRLQFHPPHQNWFKCIIFNGWVILHCVYVSQLSYLFICWWASGLLPCPGYYKQCCDDHWGTRVSFSSGFLDFRNPSHGVCLQLTCLELQRLHLPPQSPGRAGSQLPRAALGLNSGVWALAWTGGAVSAATVSVTVCARPPSVNTCMMEGAWLGLVW